MVGKVVAVARYEDVGGAAEGDFQKRSIVFVRHGAVVRRAGDASAEDVSEMDERFNVGLATACLRQWMAVLVGLEARGLAATVDREVQAACRSPLPLSRLANAGPAVGQDQPSSD